MSELVLLTPKKAADKLRKSTRTLARWRTTGYGPRYHKVGRGILYVESEVDEWINRKGYGSTSEHPGGPHSMGWIGLVGGRVSRMKSRRGGR